MIINTHGTLYVYFIPTHWPQEMEILSGSGDGVYDPASEAQHSSAMKTFHETRLRKEKERARGARDRAQARR